MQQSWSDYWKSGVKTSFGRDLAANYQGILKENWQSLWDEAKHGVQVLDIGCGNGALTELCFNALCGAGLSSRVIGIDYSDILTFELRQTTVDGNFQHLQLKSNQDFTIYADELGQFDWLISQFGFEYAPRQAALLKTAQLLKQYGQFRFVCHFSDSVFIHENSRQLAMNDFISSSDAVAKLKAMINATAMVKTPQQLTQALNTNEVNKMISPVRELTEVGMKQFGPDFISSEFMHFFQFLWTAGLTLEYQQRVALLKEFSSNHKTDCQRLQSMISAAFSQQEIAELPAKFSAVGCRLNPITELRNERGQPLAVVVSGVPN